MILKSLRSSQGKVFFDAHTGWVTHIEEYPWGEGLPKITRLDVNEWRDYHGYSLERLPDEDLDILDVGFWYETSDGESYEPPAHDWRYLMD
jgi:hypothetical protein